MLDLIAPAQVPDESEAGIMEELFNPREPVHQSMSPYNNAIPIVPPTVKQYTRLSGNWLGERDLLDTKGINFSTIYTANIAGNPVGGKTPGGFTYCDNFSFGCLIETEKLFGWHGGYLLMSALQRDGYSLSQKNIGNVFAVQQVAGGQTFKWYQLNYQQDFWKDLMSFKFGRMGIKDDFAYSPLYWLYMNNGIDGSVKALNLDGRLAGIPSAVWGARYKVDLSSTTALRLGVYQQTSNQLPGASVNGLNWNFYSDDGAVMLAQYTWSPEFCKPTRLPDTATTDDGKNVVTSSGKAVPSDKSFKAPVDVSQLKGLPGHYFMGGYYSTWQYPYPGFHNTATVPNAYGLYWHADQMVYRPNPINDAGLVLWTAYAIDPQPDIALLPFQANGGAIYTGLIPGRLNDFTIFGFAYGNFSDSYQAATTYRTYELMYELGYRINFTKFAYFQPDLQWIINPNGTDSIPNALVLGAQMGLVF